MKDVASLANARDVLYGRVVPYIPTFKPRKMANATFQVTFWIGNFTPDYAYADTWLGYEVGTADYKIFNPLQYKFRTQELIVFLCHWHRNYDEETAINFEIVRP